MNSANCTLQANLKEKDNQPIQIKQMKQIQMTQLQIYMNRLKMKNSFFNLRSSKKYLLNLRWSKTKQGCIASHGMISPYE
jgi:hypothetical protein